MALAQLPFFGLVAVIAVVTSYAVPHSLENPWFRAAMAVAVVATVVGLFTPWERWIGDWVVVIPLLDILVAAFLREALAGEWPSIGNLVVFPVLWLAYSFGATGVVTAVIGTAFVTAFPYLLDYRVPETRPEWAGVIILPAGMLAVCIAVTAASTRPSDPVRRWQSVPEQLKASQVEGQASAVTLRAVADAVDAAIIVFAEDGQILLSNRKAKALYHKGRLQSGVGHRVAPLVFEADKVTPVEIDDAIIARSIGSVRLDGRVFWVGEAGQQTAVMATSRRVEGDDGVLIGMLVVAHDVTRLMDAIQTRDDFLATVSHELKTPLTSIIGYLDLIDGDMLGISAELTVIQRNVARLERLIADLLSAGGGDTIVDRARVDLVQLAERAVSAAGEQAAVAGVELLLLPGPPLVTEVDPRHIRRVLDYLLTNAITFTDAGGGVRVSVSRDGTHAVLCVDDDGIGISPDDQRQIFVRFFRAKSSNVNAVPGAGLGLSIVEALVRAHGGTVEVASALGEGTRMTVRLPLAS